MGITAEFRKTFPSRRGMEPQEAILGVIIMSNDIYEDFLLNDIKTKQDSMRQLVAVNALLTGAYITILSGIAIKLFDPSLSRPDLQISVINGAMVFILITVLSLPVALWYLSSSKCWGFGTGVESDYVINVKDSLIQYNRELQPILAESSVATNLGLLFVMLYFVICLIVLVFGLIKWG